jgi:hypothetical protein
MRIFLIAALLSAVAPIMAVDESLPADVKPYALKNASLLVKS